MDADIFVSGKKKLRIKKYPDTCGRGLSLYFLVGDHARAFQSGEKAYAIHMQSGNTDSAGALLAKLIDVYCSVREGG